MRVGVFDCGTNSLRLLIADGAPDGGLRDVVRSLRLVRLGQGVDATGEFHPDALARTFEALDEYATVVTDHHCDRLRFVATSAARDARNREDFFAGVRQRLGVEAEIIPGDEEARLSFGGALSGVRAGADPVLVVDIGGGSTEMVTGRRDGTISHAVSLDMGSVRIRERILHGDPPTADEIARAREFIDAMVAGAGVQLPVGTFIGVAGTITSLSAIHQGLATYDRAKVHGSTLTAAEVHALAERLLATSVEEVEATTCLPRRRAEVICAGAMIADAIAARAGVPMTVSEADILDGVALEMLARA